jgi:hypothetical protein
MELHQMGKKIGYEPSKDLQLVKRQLQRRNLLVQDFSEFALKQHCHLVLRYWAPLIQKNFVGFFGGFGNLDT